MNYLYFQHRSHLWFARMPEDNEFRTIIDLDSCITAIDYMEKIACKVETYFDYHWRFGHDIRDNDEWIICTESDFANALEASINPFQVINAIVGEGQREKYKAMIANHMARKKAAEMEAEIKYFDYSNEKSPGPPPLTPEELAKGKEAFNAWIDKHEIEKPLAQKIDEAKNKAVVQKWKKRNSHKFETPLTLFENANDKAI